MDQINKPIVNSRFEPLSIIYWPYTRFCCAQSLMSDKTTDQDTSYFYILALRKYAFSNKLKFLQPRKDNFQIKKF